MVKRRRSKISCQEWKKINRIIDRKDQEIANYLDSAKIIVSANAPIDRETLMQCFRANQYTIAKNSGIVAFFRHRLTNYDRILDGMKNRWPGHSPPWDAKDRLRRRISMLCTKYLKSIGASDLKQPTFKDLKRWY